MSNRSVPDCKQENTSNLFVEPAALAAEESAPDPFDPARLRLSQDFGSALGVKKVLTTIRCRKPTRQEFVRVRPGEDWRLETGVFEEKVARETYLVDPSLWTDLAGEINHMSAYS